MALVLNLKPVSEGTMTTRGICKLCKLQKDLQDSHFIGKAVYKKLMGAIH
jgi:hypothetical protein